MARYGYGDRGGWGGWAPYVSVAERRRSATRKMESLRKKGVDVQPVEIVGRKIAHSFWGEAWCEHLEAFSDYENRLPRGRTYVRNGSVCHLALTKGKIEAKVSGSELYDVVISIKTLPVKTWQAIKARCGGQIGSLLELLQGRLSDHVMEVVTDRQTGLFPQPGEITLRCSCPDGARMCKHVAAVLYGVGARLDGKPELLFLLRGVNHEELIEADAEQAVAAATSRGKSKRLATASLDEVFGIQIDTAAKPSCDTPAAAPAARAVKASASRAKKTASKQAAPAAPRRSGTKQSSPSKTPQRAARSAMKQPSGKTKQTKQKSAVQTVKSRRSK